MVIDLLTQIDKDKIESYRNTYASCYESMERKASIEHILRCWNEAKSEYLEKLFGNQLIITRPVEFNEDEHDLWDKMSSLIHHDSRNFSFYREICKIYTDKAVGFPWSSTEQKMSSFVNHLFNEITLTDNKISDNRWFGGGKNTFDLLIGDEIFKIQKGSKPMRIISKIANAYKIGIEPDENGITDFEYFRRKHSLALNQKTLKGDLCLSIHPLDYMTMSDNNAGWDSCMSWENNGEYKQGTVEMMNSPSVIVAYLSSGPEDFGWYDYPANSHYYWNSKKWRSLFVVDKDFIINVRSYPYQNNNLVKEAIKEIAKLAGWGNIEPKPYDYIEKYRCSRTPVVIDGREVAIDFCTQAMYNDFGGGHFIALNPNETKSIINYSYNYSGYSECVWCGDTNKEACVGTENGESYLHCSICNEHWECEWCGESEMYDRSCLTGEGYRICEYCWENSTDKDIISEQYYMSENLQELCLAKINDVSCITPKHFNCCNTAYFYEDNVGNKDWYTIFKIDEPREIIKHHEYWTETIYYVLPEDLTEEGIRAFGYIDEDDLKKYMGTNEDN